MVIVLMDSGVASKAVHIAISSALVDDGHIVDEHPYKILRVGIIHPEPIIGESFESRILESREPSVYISSAVVLWAFASKDILVKASVRSIIVLSEWNEDLINCTSKSSMRIDGSGGSCDGRNISGHRLEILVVMVFVALFQMKLSSGKTADLERGN